MYNIQKRKENVNMKKFIIAMVLVLLFASCGSSTGEKESKLIKVGLSDTYPPFEYRDENNELVGFDIDLIELLSEEMGVEVEIVNTAWDGIFVGLDSGKFDMIVSATSITPERLENFEQSKPYLANGQVIVVKKGDTSISKPEDLADKQVGVQLETTADNAAEKHKETVPFELTKYDDIVETFSDLLTGRLDAVVVDYGVAIDYVSKSPDDFEITSAQLTNEPLGVTMKKGNTELKEEVNKALENLQKAGKMKELSEKWFNGDYTSNIDEELK